MEGRLFAYGCSHTYGEGLRDCWIPAGKTIDGIVGPDAGSLPSKYAWPKLLADKMEIECHNYSRAGVSNKFIWHKILNTPFNEKDIVIVLWTYYNRTCILENKNSSRRIMASDIGNPHITEEKESFSKIYYEKYYYDYDVVTQSIGYFNHIKSYLDNIKVANHHLIISDCLERQPVPEWNQVKLHPIKLRYDLPLAEDNKHPGEESHQILSDEIYTIIDQSK